jgi:hypothetical protein
LAPARGQRRDRRATWRLAEQRQRVGVASSIIRAAGADTEQPVRGEQAKPLPSDYRLAASYFGAQQADLGRRQLAAAERYAAAPVREQPSEADDATADGPHSGPRRATQGKRSVRAAAVAIAAFEIKVALHAGLLERPLPARRLSSDRGGRYEKQSERK